MIQELSEESRRMGLNMNIAMKKLMVVGSTQFKVNNMLIEHVEGYYISVNTTVSRKRNKTK